MKARLKASLVLVICVCYSRLISGCRHNLDCPNVKVCCSGICRYSCFCQRSFDCDWQEKCCFKDHQCVDSFDLCPQYTPLYIVLIGTSAILFLTLLCVLLICYSVHCCPWYKRRIAKRRNQQDPVTVGQPVHYTTVSSTNMRQELHCPNSPPMNLAPPAYSAPQPGNPSKYSSYTVQRMSFSTLYSPPYSPRT